MSGYDQMRKELPDISRQLLPCPFCGGDVYLKEVSYRHYGARPIFCVNHRKWAPKSCLYHSSRNHITFVDPRQALNEWNRRAWQ